jgi:hypothetical protein
MDVRRPAELPVSSPRISEQSANPPVAGDMVRTRDPDTLIEPEPTDSGQSTPTEMALGTVAKRLVERAEVHERAAPAATDTAASRPLVKPPLHQYVHIGAMPSATSLRDLERRYVDADFVTRPDNPYNLPPEQPLEPEMVAQGHKAKAAIDAFAADKLGLDISDNTSGPDKLHVYEDRPFDAWLARGRPAEHDTDVSGIMGMAVGRHILARGGYRDSDFARTLIHEGIHVATPTVWKTSAIPSPDPAAPAFRLEKLSMGFVKPGDTRHFSLREYATESATREVASGYAPTADLQVSGRVRYAKLMRLGDYAIEHAASSPALRHETTADELLRGLHRGLLTADPTPLVTIARTLPPGLRKELATVSSHRQAEIQAVRKQLVAYHKRMAR